MVDASREGVRIAIARGVTSVHDKDGWLGALGVWQRLRDEGSLHLRVWQSIPAEQVDDLRVAPHPERLGDDLVRVGYLKAFMDGTLGSQTARMLDGSGVQITSREQLADFIRRGAAAGLPRGRPRDRRPREPRGPRRLRGDAGASGRRSGSVTGSSTRSSWRGRTSPASPSSASPRPSSSAMRPSDARIAERFWAGKTDRAYAYRSLRDSGALLANGSDAPIEELSPWDGIVAGVSRDWHPEQRLTLDEALEATTVNPAWLARDEHRRGKLIPGYLADLVVLDRDPFALEPEELPEVKVVATMLGGRWTHGAPPWEDRAG